MKLRLDSALRLSVAPPLAALLLGACGSAPPPPPPVIPPPEPEAAEVEGPDPRYTALPTPSPSEPVDWTPPAGARFTLENGIRVWHLEHGAAPLVSLKVVIPRGSSADPPNRAGLTHLVADLLDEGAGSRSALELNEELGLLATDYDASVGVDYILLSMDLLAENLEPSVALLSDILRRPRLSRDEFERRKQHQLSQILANEAQPRVAQSVAVHRALFADGYASTLPQGTRPGVQAITYEDVRRQYRRLIAPEGMEIIAVGGVSQERLKQALQQSLESWTGKAQAEAKPVAPPPDAHPIYVVHYAGAAQSALGIARRVEGARDPDYFPALVANRPLGEAFTSRINMNLREDKGYTYGARSDFRRYREAGYFGVSTNVRTDVTRASIDEIFRELGDVCESRPLTEVERNEAVSGMLLGYPATFERIEQVAMRFASVPIYDRPADFWQTWPDKVEAVTIDHANRVAGKYCNPAEYSIVIAGDRNAIEESLASLGRNIVELDRSGNVKPAAKD